MGILQCFSGSRKLSLELRNCRPVTMVTTKSYNLTFCRSYSLPMYITYTNFCGNLRDATFLIFPFRADFLCQQLLRCDHKSSTGDTNLIYYPIGYYNRPYPRPSLIVSLVVWKYNTVQRKQCVSLRILRLISVVSVALCS